MLGGDGCDATCGVEGGYTCAGIAPDVCTEACSTNAYSGNHECGDGNLAPLDGCDPNCLIERGWKCINGLPGTPDTCNELCGDGINWKEHDCDDGNRINGDGCDENCTFENKGPDRWVCSSGNELDEDHCQEWCGDGMRFDDPKAKFNPRRFLFHM